jgi:hypothetical protein
VTDPRVTVYFPNFSPYHAEALTLTARWLGLRAGAVVPLDRSQLDRGLQFTSGRECLPLPICLGLLLQIHDQLAAGEVAGFYMIRGGAPCVSHAYPGYFERFLVEHRLPDLFLLNASQENDYLGFDQATLAAHLAPAIFIADYCLPFRVSEAILKPLCIQSGMPILTYESDGYPVSPAVLRQVDVHIQQVLERAAKNHPPSPDLGQRAADLLKSVAARFRQ